MSLYKKILFSIIFFLILLMSHTYTYYIADEKAQLKAYFVNIKMDNILLKAMDNNQTDIVKNILTWSSGSLFYEVGIQKDIQKFYPICKYINQENIYLLEKSRLCQDLNSSDEEIREVNKITKIGKEKIKKLCNFK